MTPKKVTLFEAAGSEGVGSEMADKRVEVGLDGLVLLQSAAGEFARTEVSRIVQAVTENLRSRPAIGIFCDVAVRHASDEYCWAIQNGPFDYDNKDESLGSVWVEGGIADMVMEGLNDRAVQLNLDLMGPNCGDAIDYEIEGSGMVWSVLSERGDPQISIRATTKAGTSRSRLKSALALGCRMPKNASSNWITR